MKKLLTVILSFLLLSVSMTPFGAHETAIFAHAFVLYCPDSDEVILSQNADEQLPMASTTKILTALIALEYAEEDNITVEFTDEMTAEGSSMYLQSGEKLTLDDLAVGMMMQSGNDAANAAAIAISGSMEGFASLMNEKAAEIGMQDSHFVTPSGLDDEEHYSTAADMARLMAYAMQNERFAAITSQTSMTVDLIEPDGKSVTYPNHNKLLRLYDACIGGKTGYTDKSGRCLVSAAQKDGFMLVAVTLDDPNDWDDHIALYDFGFDNYTRVSLSEDIEYDIAVVGGVEDSLRLIPQAEYTPVLKKSIADEIEKKVYMPPFVYAPTEQGEAIGMIRYTVGSETVCEIPLLAAESVNYDDHRRGILEYLKDILIRKK